MTQTSASPPPAETPASQAPEPTAVEALDLPAQNLLRGTGASDAVIDRFLRDLEEDPDPTIDGLLGRQPQEPSPPAAEQPEPTKAPEAKPPEQAAPPTREQQVATYGETVVAKAEEAGIDLIKWAEDYVAERDTSEQRQAMATALGLPVEIIAQYEAGGRPAQKAPEPAAFGEADAKALQQWVGGESQFAALDQWVSTNLDPADPAVAGFNAAVEANNADAARAWLSTLQVLYRYEAGFEPELIQGGAAAAPEADVYLDYKDLQADLAAVDQRSGKRRYDVDPKFRKYVEQKTARSSALG